MHYEQLVGDRIGEGLSTTRPESAASYAMGCVGYNLRALVTLAVLVGYAIVKHL